MLMMNIIYILFQVSSFILISLACIDINRENNTRQYADTQYTDTQYTDTQLTDNDGNSFIIITNEDNIISHEFTDKNIFNEFKKVLEKKDSFNFSEESVLKIDKNIYINRWINNNNLGDIIENKKGIIIDINSLEENLPLQDFKKFLKNLKTLEKVCFDNSIILFIIGEKPYYEFIDEHKYFNSINYVSPYHYTKTWTFGKPIKLPVGKFGKKPFNVSINEMISDISNQYGILTKDLTVVYFDKSCNSINYNCDHLYIK
tara:strand:- start:1458 stop:2234 length:777 start_codon:yes stop_codon:yes gene_type:complete